MAEITASLVKELRERTGAGMMDCKKALTEANGDIELAIENMRKSGAIKAAKKAGNVAADGVIKTKIDGNYGIILEVNCQTDFVAKDAGFQAFADKVLDAAVAGKITDVEVLKAQFEEERVALVAKIGENINIRRVAALEGDVLGSYQHGARIGVLVAAKGADEELVKHIAMHVAASKPEFIKPEDVSAEVVEKEYQVQLDIAMQSGKPKEIAEKMVEGRMKKFTGEVSLTGQPFVMEPAKTVGQLLKEHNALEEKEWDRLSETKSSIAFCPTSNLYLGSGLFNLQKAWQKKVKVGMGTDIGAGTTFNMLQTLNEAYKVLQLQGYRLSAYEAFYLATLGGAKSLGLDNLIGNFMPGKEADFVVMEPTATPLQQLRYDNSVSLVDKLFVMMTLGDDRSIYRTYVDGRLVYERN